MASTLIFNGSAQKRGNTTILIDWFIQGASEFDFKTLCDTMCCEGFFVFDRIIKNGGGR